MWLLYKWIFPTNLISPFFGYIPFSSLFIRLTPGHPWKYLKADCRSNRLCQPHQFQRRRSYHLCWSSIQFYPPHKVTWGTAALPYCVHCIFDMSLIYLRSQIVLNMLVFAQATQQVFHLKKENNNVAPPWGTCFNIQRYFNPIWASNDPFYYSLGKTQ